MVMVTGDTRREGKFMIGAVVYCSDTRLVYVHARRYRRKQLSYFSSSPAEEVVALSFWGLDPTAPQLARQG